MTLNNLSNILSNVGVRPAAKIPKRRYGDSRSASGPVGIRKRSLHGGEDQNECDVFVHILASTHIHQSAEDHFIDTTSYSLLWREIPTAHGTGDFPELHNQHKAGQARPRRPLWHRQR